MSLRHGIRSAWGFLTVNSHSSSQGPHRHQTLAVRSTTQTLRSHPRPRYFSPKSTLSLSQWRAERRKIWPPDCFFLIKKIFSFHNGAVCLKQQHFYPECQHRWRQDPTLLLHTGEQIPLRMRFPGDTAASVAIREDRGVLRETWHEQGVTLDREQVGDTKFPNSSSQEVLQWLLSRLKYFHFSQNMLGAIFAKKSTIWGGRGRKVFSN